MSIFTTIRGAFAPALVILALSFTASADTLRLKDGSILKGKIASFGNGSFVIVIGEGSRRRELKFAAAEVESIQFDTIGGAPALNSSPARTASYREYKDPAPRPAPVSSRPAATSPRPAPISSVPAPVSTVQNNPPVVSQPKSSEKMKPIEWQVKVLADNTSNGWTNTGWVLKKGQRIRIAADEGTISIGKGQKTTASGLGDVEDSQKLLKNVPTGALIAVIGDDNNDFIYVGSEREFTATRDGALFLGINEGNLNDNSGALNVKIEILPGG